MSKRATSTSSIADTLGFPFRGSEATNRLLIGIGLLFLSIIVPILPALVVYGYLLQIMHDVIDGQPASMPEWKDWGRLLVDGLKAFFVGLVYLLPALVVFTIGGGLYCGTTFLSIIASEGAGPSAASEGAYATLLILSMVVFFASFAIGTILSLLGALPLPAAQAGLAEDSSLGSAFALGRLYRIIRANPGGHIVAWLVFAGLWAFLYWGMMAAYYTIVLACVIPFLVLPVAFYTMLVAAALFGEAYRDGADVLARAEKN